MKYILPLLLLLSACTPDTKTTTDAASAPKTHGFAHRLTEGEKLLTQALIKQDLAAYFKHETGGAFAEQAPLFSAQQLAEQKNIPQNDAIGVYGKIIKTQGPTARLQTHKQTHQHELAETQQEAEGQVTQFCQTENTVFQDCQTEENFARRFTEQIFSAVESGRVSAQTDAPAEEIMAGRLIPFLSAASDFTGNFKACATTMTEYCTSRLAREMPESAVRKKAQELGLTEIAFKKKK